MNCPVCTRILAPTLSICPACGAMMNDTVREELQPKISTRLSPRMNTSAAPAFERQPVTPRPAVASPVPSKKRTTTGLVTHKTSQTLVEFQNKNTSVPDWRIKLQNAVQQRKGGSGETTPAEVSNYPDKFSINNEAPLKAARAPQADVEARGMKSDPRVASAMRRIEESLKTFQEMPAKSKKPPAPLRPLGVVPTSAPRFGGMATAAAPAKINTAPKPMLVSAPVLEKRDTNKLPPIEHTAKPEIVIAEPTLERIDEVDEIKKPESGSLPVGFPAPHRIHIRTENFEANAPQTEGLDAEDIEDLAPVSMRFGAGLFDFIIGGFSSMLLLSPLAFTSADWFTPSSLLTLVGTWSVVMFVYMTACLGFFGKTMGMRLFQLELVDALDNEYPTIRQASINSSLFLISLAFAGAGFLAMYFNEEKRALHDLLSGTIIVREF